MKVFREYKMTLVPENASEKVFLDNTIPALFKYSNPKREKELKHSVFSKEPKFIETYYKRKDGAYILFKANYEIILKMIEQRIQINFVDLRTYGDKISVNCKYSPRDLQQRECLNVFGEWFRKFGYGCIDATPGAGKSYLAINLICKMGVKPLIVVDQNLLADQWVDYFLEYTDIKIEDIGFIRGDKNGKKGSGLDYKDKKVIIGMAQTLIKYDDVCKEISENIGMLIFDEVHIASCKTFQEIIPRFKPKYQLGLSGSHDRDDKMDFLIKQSVGPIVYTFDREQGLQDNSIVQPVLWPIFIQNDREFDKYNSGDVKFRKIVDEAYMNMKAIQKIVNLSRKHYNKDESMLFICKEKQMVETYYETILNTYLVTEDEKVAIESKRLEEIENLRKGISEKEALQLKKYTKTRQDDIVRSIKKMNNLEEEVWYNLPFAKEIAPKMKECVTLVGDDRPDFRDEVMAKGKTGEIKIIITTSLFDKALSINRLKILFLTFSSRERATLKQRLGRVGRPHKMKTPSSPPIVYDVIYDSYMSFRQFKNRREDCRMRVYEEGFAMYHNSIFKLTDYLEERFSEGRYSMKEKEDFIETWKPKYVIEI